MAIDHRITKILVQIRDSLNELIEVFDDSPKLDADPVPRAGRKKKELVEKVPTKAKDFIAAYCDRFKIQWGHHPQIFPKQAGIAKAMSSHLTLERFAFYLDAYFQMPDAWIVKAKHPLEFFQIKFNEIQVFAHSGKFTSQREVLQADDSVSLMSQLQRIEDGKL